jgi:hypothetical protein
VRRLWLMPVRGSGCIAPEVSRNRDDHRHQQLPTEARVQEAPARNYPKNVPLIVTPAPMMKGPLRRIIRLHEQETPPGARADPVRDRHAGQAEAASILDGGQEQP